METVIPQLQHRVQALQAAFVAVLPRIQHHGLLCLRGVQDYHVREELLAELVALSWLWFTRLVRARRDPTPFIKALATFAARAVRSGRRLCGLERAGDVLSRRAQQRRGFCLIRLERSHGPAEGVLADALHGSTQSSPAEQAAFRHDFPLWLSQYGRRYRRIALDMALGHRTGELARRHGCSRARISQLRREFCRDWRTFCGEPPARAASANRESVLT